MRHAPRRGRRPGFTLIELLVVVAIIGILLTLTTAAVQRAAVLGPKKATEATVKLTSSRLKEQFDAVRTRARDDTGSPDYAAFKAYNAGLATPLTGDALRQGYIQAKLTQAFPTTFAEALNPGYGLPALAQYRRYLNSPSGNTASGANTAPFEAGVCLMMILTVGPNNNASPDDFATKADFTLANNKVVKGLTDSYGTPLSFSRAAGGPVVTSAGPDQKLGTPDDITSNSQ
jgi:prepilin-type N-terminal cleavage/methylation domain-containing protein